MMTALVMSIRRAHNKWIIAWLVLSAVAFVGLVIIQTLRS
jgi:hypothetical protein